MVQPLVLVVALAQQPALPQPVARIVIEPAQPTVQAGDTLRLRATAYDSAGRRLDDAVIGWFTAGRGFEGSVDSTGLVHGGSTGALRVAAVARIPGRAARSTVAFASVAIVAPPATRVVVAPRVARLLAGTSVSLEAVPYAATGDRRYDPVIWRSSAPGIARIDAAGRLTGVAPGRATIAAGAGSATDAWSVTVVANAVTRVAVTPVDTAVRTGDVVRLVLHATDAGGRAVADARPEWSLLASPGGRAAVDGDGGFVADEPGTYRVLCLLGSRRAEAVVRVAPRLATRQAQIVGRLPLKGALAAELWVHPDGRHAYLSTISDRVYAIDITNPAAPVITDSVLVDARVINDVMTTEDGRYGVLTRENASTRRNGIVILSFEDPAHPRPIAEFTETVTGGVHSAFVSRGYVYLTDDATGSLRVIDIRDPYHPRQVARWQTPTEAGRVLHDVDVRDGLAYLSYWNDGLVILDVGAGITAGSPESPQLVSQFKYDLNALYKRVELVGGPGFIRGTHTAWRHGRYVFVGDEVFSAAPPEPGQGIPSLGLGRAYGRLHVIDVSDLARPRAVAWFEPPDGGAHNVWVAGDTLFFGDYQGGLRVLDISGELRGDLLAQGREIAHVHTGDPQGFVPNAALTWGAVYRDGLIYVNDVNSGLWIVRLAPNPPFLP